MKLAELIDPMPGKVAVQIRSTDEITRHGLYLPAESNRSLHDTRATQGVVVAIGEADDSAEIDYLVCQTCQMKFTDNEAAESHLKIGSNTYGNAASICNGQPNIIEIAKRRFKVGDTVVFGKYSGTEVSYQHPPEDPEANVIERKARPPRERVILMTEKDILAVIRRPEEAEAIKVKG